MRKKAIRSLSMANWLCVHGFRIKWIEASKSDKGHQVFIFEDTPELQKCMSQYGKQ